jgi:hypothetical protein
MFFRAQRQLGGLPCWSRKLPIRREMLHRDGDFFSIPLLQLVLWRRIGRG